MAERSLSIRVSLKDYEKVQAGLLAMGAEGHRALARIEDSSQKASKGMKETGGAAGLLESQMLRLGGTVAAAFSVREVVRMSDSYTLLTGKLKLVTGSAAELASVQQQLFQLAQENRVNLEATAGLYSRMAQASSNLGLTQQQVIQLTDTLQKAFRVSGASAQEAAAGTLQLSQAFASGKLQGDEFRSVSENGTRVMKALQDATGKTQGQLREMSKEGELTGRVLATSLLSQARAVGEEFSRLPKTVGEAHTQLGNAMTRFVANDGPIQAMIGAYKSLIGVITGAVTAMADFEAKLYDPAEQAEFNVRQTRELLKADPNNPQLKAILADAEAKLSAIDHARKNDARTGKGGVGGGGGGGEGGDGRKVTDADKRALGEYIESLEEENRLVRMTARDRAVAEKVLRAENAARRAGKDLTADQRAEVEKLASAVFDYEKAQKDAEERAKKAAEAQKEMWRPVEHALERVQDEFADMLADGEFSFKSLAGIAKRAAAEIASAMIFRPIIGGITGSIFPGISGSVTGGAAGTTGGIGNTLSTISGLSSLGSFLTGGDLGVGSLLAKASFYTGIGSPTTMQTIGNMFTPGAALGGFGGNLLGNLLLGNRGIGASIGGGIGGIGGTIAGTQLLGSLLGSWAGPVGAFVGSLAGNAIGGLFGGGKPHPQASFASLVNPDESLAIQSVLSKHMDTDGVTAMADQLSTFLKGLASVSDVRYRNYGVHGISNPGFTGFQTNSGQVFGFNADDPSSIAGAFRDLALYLAKGAEVVDTKLVTALQNVQVQGRDAAGVLAAVTSQLGGIKSLKAFSDALGTDPATTNLSPEELYRKAAAAFNDTVGQYTAGTAGADAVQAAALTYLQYSQGYAGRASGTYAGDLGGVRDRLNSLIAVAPRFDKGGDFGPGINVAHQGEIVMFSRTGGTVINARDTERLVSGGGGGNDLMLYQAFNDLKATMERMIEWQARIASGLARVASA